MRVLFIALIPPPGARRAPWDRICWGQIIIHIGSPGVRSKASRFSSRQLHRSTGPDRVSTRTAWSWRLPGILAIIPVPSGPGLSGPPHI